MQIPVSGICAALMEPLSAWLPDFLPGMTRYDAIIYQLATLCVQSVIPLLERGICAEFSAVLFAWKSGITQMLIEWPEADRSRPELSIYLERNRGQ